MKFSKYLLVVIALMSSTVYLKSQPNFGMWNTFSLEKEFSKKFSAGIDEEMRLKDNLAHLNLFYTNLGASYRPVKGIKLSLIYRFTQKYKTSVHDFNFRNRLMFDASFKYHLSNLVFAYRSRIQAEVVNDQSPSPEWFWRDKFEIKYNLHKLTPYLGTELRYQITVPKHPETDRGWHRARFFVGVDYSFTKNSELGIYYMRQHEFYILDPNELSILGLQYSLTLPHKKQ